VDDRGVPEDDRRGEEERAHQQPQHLADRAFVAALAPHLEVHDVVLVAERGIHQEVQMRAHSAHRSAVRSEQEDDGSVHL
jgi:hypothetical protein